VSIELDRGSNENNNPHTKVIGKKFLSGFKKNKTYIEYLKFSEFAEIPFGTCSGYPRMANDLVKYLTNIDVEEFYRLKAI
jgi:hypothetical protein